MIIEENQRLLDGLPPETLKEIDGCCNEFLLQVGLAWSLRDQPLPENFVPEMVDVFVNGNDEPCVYVYQGDTKILKKEFFADRDRNHFVIMINEEPRYVEINGEQFVNSLGGCILPDLLVSPEAQLSCLTQLMES